MEIQEMSTIKMPEEIDHNRRSFCGTTAIAVAADLGIFGSKEARADELKPAGATASKPDTNTSFGPSSRSMPAS
jgi:hypothetical protein